MPSPSPLECLCWPPPPPPLSCSPRQVLVEDRQPKVSSHAVLLRVPGGGQPGGRASLKELGAWEGSNCYYCVGALSPNPSTAGAAAGATSDAGAQRPQRRTYLVYDGIVATNAEPTYHRFPMTVALISHLVALAVATDRILVLPAVLQMQKWMHGPFPRPAWHARTLENVDPAYSTSQIPLLFVYPFPRPITLSLLGDGPSYQRGR